MSIKRNYFFSCAILHFILLPFLSFGQIEFAESTIKVYKNDLELAYPFAGGINSAQFGELDINQDGIMDLVLLDRTSDKITCFINSGEAYLYSSSYDHLFPSDLEKWMVLADYNCDGKNDLFTYSSLGIRVFENTSNTALSWQKVVDPLLTQVNSDKFNITLNATDIPSIVDMDQDGDLDILHYNFTNGDFIEYHENKSNELSKNCGLVYYRTTTRYGDIETCVCDVFSFEGQSCHVSSKLNHVIGKTLMSFDADQDGDMDLVMSEDNCNHLNFLENSGIAISPIFKSSTSLVPNASTPIDWLGFPSAFYLDVTFDGKKDLIVAQNLRENPGVVNFAQSIVLYVQTAPNIFSNGKPFLQDQMIDIGEYSYPALGDVNGDGLLDLLIGYGLADQSLMKGSIAWYKSSEKGLIFQTDDAFQFSNLGLHYVRPQLIDINMDGKIDLVFQAITANNKRVFGYLINMTEKIGLQFNVTAVKYIDFAISSDSDYLIYDWDNDGAYDLLEATYFGELRYYLGEEDFGRFDLHETAILNSTGQLDEYNLSFSIFDIDQDGTEDLITARRPGILDVYPDIRNNQTEYKTQLFKIENSTDLLQGKMGKYAKPMGGILGTKPVLVVGGIQGGIQIFDSKYASSEENLTLDIYPNPSLTNIFTVECNKFGSVIQVIDCFGQIHYQSVQMDHSVSAKIDLSLLNKGIYLIRLLNGGMCKTKKVIVN